MHTALVIDNIFAYNKLIQFSTNQQAVKSYFKIQLLPVDTTGIIHFHLKYCNVFHLN